MKKTLSTACALFALAMAGSALADGSVRVTLESPVAGHTKLIAAHAVFNCEGTSCVASTAPDDANDAYACKDLAKHVGRIVAYQEFKPLDEKALAKCNSVAAAPKPIGTASR
ncbi:MAG: hypothetical protein JWO83_4502 [Caulobacteraceae bacterium]|nr:hypothetical protein [Caulobacteraceae bacterium]